MTALVKLLLPNGLGTRGLLALMVIGGLIYRNAPVEILAPIAAGIIGFYFGQRDASAAQVRSTNGGT